MKRRYSILFLYSDNNQVYDQDVWLTDEELERVAKFLKRLKKKGYIKQHGGESVDSPLIHEYWKPIVIGFKALVDNWTSGSLIQAGLDHRIKL